MDTTANLTAAYALYRSGISNHTADESIKTLSHETSALQSKIYERLWALKGAPKSIPDYGKYCFHQTRGFTSTPEERAYAIYEAAVLTRNVALVEALDRIGKVHLVFPKVMCYFEVNGQLMPVYRPAQKTDMDFETLTSNQDWGEETTTSGRYRFFDEVEYAHVGPFDDRDEVATSDVPAQPSANAVAFRAIPGVDYTKYGYEKIGRVWASRDQYADNVVARRRFVEEETTALERLGQSAARGLTAFADAVFPKGSCPLFAWYGDSCRQMASSLQSVSDTKERLFPNPVRSIKYLNS